MSCDLTTFVTAVRAADPPILDRNPMPMLELEIEVDGLTRLLRVSEVHWRGVAVGDRLLCISRILNPETGLEETWTWLRPPPWELCERR